MSKHFTRYLHSILLSVITLLFVIPCKAQSCDPPTSATITPTAIVCRSDGAITVTNVSGNTAGQLQYSLYDALNSTELRGWQDTNIFSDLVPATYRVRIRYSCSNGFSTAYNSGNVTVGGNYTDPTITNIEVLKNAQCNNGLLRVSATAGKTPYQYALVSSQNASEPISAGNYVRPPQSSNIFRDLAAGTYYVRVYDACNSYVTRNVTVGTYTPAANLLSTLSFRYDPCNSLTGVLNFSTLNTYSALTDVRALTITFPDGSTEALPAPVSSAPITFDIPMEKLGTPDPSAVFPDNISGWPKVFTVNYTDECGTIYSKEFSYVKPAISLSIAAAVNQSENPDACGSQYVYGYLNFSTPLNFGSVILTTGAEYRINDGPWVAVVPTTNGAYTGTQPFIIPFGQNANVCVRICGVEYCRQYNSLSPNFSTALAEINRTSCPGNSGIAFRSSTSTGSVAFPVQVKLVSAPAGVTIPDFTYTHGSSQYAYPEATDNLPLGTYTFSMTDACGKTLERSITISHPLEQLTATYAYPCGSTDLRVTFSNTAFLNANGTTTPGGFVWAQIYAADGMTTINSARRNSSLDNQYIDIPTATIPNGDYVIKFWRETATECMVELPWTKTSAFISLSNLMMGTVCPGTPATSTIVATAGQGVPPYRYSLYRNSYTPENLVVPSQSGNIFNDVQGTGPFIVFAEDACGRGTQGTVSTDVASLRVSNDAGGVMPCPGENLTLSILKTENATYQWYKDDVAISGATDHTFAVTGIDEADKGKYTVELSFGSCPYLYKGFDLDPNKCNTPLPVNLINFTLAQTKIENRPAVKISWQTTQEHVNQGFEVQRSTNSFSWTAVGYVNSKSANGDFDGVLDYVLIDTLPSPGTSYYRLKQSDLDGTLSFSRILAIHSDTDSQFTISPNPSSDKIVITGDLQQIQSVRIFNSKGMEMACGDFNSKNKALDIRALPTGLYVIAILNTHGQWQSQTFFKH
jgi:hypothetical protein